MVKASQNVGRHLNVNYILYRPVYHHFDPVQFLATYVMNVTRKFFNFLIF